MTWQGRVHYNFRVTPSGVWAGSATLRVDIAWDAAATTPLELESR